MKSLHSFLNLFFPSKILRLLAITISLLAALTWSSFGFSGENHSPNVDSERDKSKLDELKQGAPYELDTTNSGTTVHDAVLKGDLEKVKALLKDNPDLVFQKDMKGNTPLHIAAIKGFRDIVAFLLDNKADVNANDNNVGTPLLLAAIANHKDVIALLIANKADVNAKGIGGFTSLHIAARKNSTDVAEMLIASNADVNAKENNDGVTPLHLAAISGSKDVAKLLLANGADVNAKANRGETPLKITREKNKEMIELLRQYGGHE